VDLTRTNALGLQLLWRDSVPSTNALLVDMQTGTAEPGFTTVVTDDQTAGRGRLNRSWVAPAGTALAISTLLVGPLLQPALRGTSWGWLPIAAGLAMAESVTSCLPATANVGLKWPNDVQIDGRKVSGILAEVVPHENPAVVIGAGLNVTMTRDQLPVPTATSLTLEGADPDELFDRALSAYLGALVSRTTALADAAGDADRSGLLAEAVERCATIGLDVRVELPGGDVLHGRAIGIDSSGRLEVRDDAGQVRAVAAGDIIHLRSDG
jgi:BirA family transcriptional regulator, biotin operon repressor / biotin---[acetyl-CoA-carboxylase] ligase